MGMWKEKYIWSCTDLSSSLGSNNCKKKDYFIEVQLIYNVVLISAVQK